MKFLKRRKTVIKNDGISQSGDVNKNIKLIFSREKASSLIKGGEGRYMEAWVGPSGGKYG